MHCINKTKPLFPPEIVHERRIVPTQFCLFADILFGFGWLGFWGLPNRQEVVTLFLFVCESLHSVFNLKKEHFCFWFPVSARKYSMWIDVTSIKKQTEHVLSTGPSAEPHLVESQRHSFWLNQQCNALFWDVNCILGLFAFFLPNKVSSIDKKTKKTPLIIYKTV